jgi:hypothetical protein
MTRDPTTSDEERERDADVAETKGVGCDAADTDGQQDRVSGLVGSEAEVVGIASSVLHADGKGEHEELAFEEKVFANGLVEVGQDVFPVMDRGRARVGFQT